MLFLQTLAAGAAFVAAASAIAINQYPNPIEAGKTYTITYDDKSNTPTTFLLRKGKSTDLKTLATLTSSATGGSYTWTVDKGLVDGDDYALQVVQGDQSNYSGLIKLTGGSTASASSSASASASASSASSKSASSASSASASSASAASVTSKASSLSAAASASASISNSSNGTVTSAVLSGSRTPSATGSAQATGSSTHSAGAPQNTGAASTLVTSPLALVFGAVAAMIFLN